MGKIAVILRVMPEDAETDLEALRNSIEERIDVNDFKEDEVAFGLKALLVSTMTTDEEGGTDYVENQLEDIEGVQSISIESFNKV